jgi:hypothetical protein
MTRSDHKHAAIVWLQLASLYRRTGETHLWHWAMIRSRTQRILGRIK